jgi:hypothetical protein
MITLKATFEWHNKEAIALQCEHIAGLIRQGYPKGDGWEIEGKEEAEKIIQLDEEYEVDEDDPDWEYENERDNNLSFPK